MVQLILRMSFPSVAAQFVNMLYGIVDRIYIGHISVYGTTALAGVGICSSVIILVSAFAQFTGSGGASLASIAMGKGEKEKAEKMMNCGIFLLLIFSLGLMAAIYLFMKPILYAVGASSDTIPYALNYLSIYMSGTLFALISTGLNSFINLQGYPGTAMMSVILGAVLNIILDPVFIFTFNMGVAGAALATVLSQAVSAVWILHFLSSKKAQIHLNIKEMKPDTGILKPMLSLGISPFVMNSTESIIGFVMNSGLEKYGDIYVSALAIMQSCMQIYSVPLNGFTQGASPVISWNYGHGNKDRVKEGFRIIFLIMTFFNGLMTFWMILKPRFFASFFTSDGELLNLVTGIMPVFLVGMTIFGMQRACQTMFVALNEPKVSLFIALLRKILLLVPLALILPHFMGYMGIYTAEAIADGTAAVICMIVFLHRFPVILKQMDERRSA